MHWGLLLGSGDSVNYDFLDELTPDQVTDILDRYRDKEANLA